MLARAAFNWPAAFALGACVLLASGCPGRESSRQGKTSAQQQDAPLSAWLDPQAQISQNVRLSTSNGEDLREARYLRSGKNVAPDILALLRNYQDRDPARPDKMRLIRLEFGASQPTDVPTSPDAPPIHILASPDRMQWSYCGWLQPPASQVTAGRVVLVDGAQSVDKDAPTQTLPDSQTPPAGSSGASTGFWPLSYVGAGRLACHPITRMDLYNGLPMPLLDYKALSLQELGSGKGSTTSSGVYLPSPDGRSAAGFAISYDPALPGQSTVMYSTGSLPGAPPRQQHSWAFPYFVTYTPYNWEPALAWADNSHLIALTFMPEPNSPADKPHGSGLFRLLCMDADSGDARLVEDRLLATTSIIAADGLVFYATSPGLSSPSGAWELWAASADGLRKHRLYSAMNTLGLEPVDIIDGRRLLLHHQFFDNASNIPVLRSELIEFSLDASGGQQTQAIVLDPLPQARGIEDNGAPAALPEAKGGEDEDLFPGDKSTPVSNGGEKPGDKYGRGKGGGDFIPDEPGAGSDGGSGDSGGHGGTPPPIDPD